PGHAPADRAGVVCVRDAALARRRSRPRARARHDQCARSRRTRRVPPRFRRCRHRGRAHHLREAAAAMTASALGPGALLSERSLLVYSRTWLLIVSGFFEPLFYLFSMGIGLGHYVGKVPVEGVGLVSYGSFVAPALLASAAMNGAAYECINIFFKL